jgi:hypothetical protein
MRALALVLVTFLSQKALADLTVFDVRKPIAMSDKDNPQKDYYINAGSESGVQAGMIITVVRKVPLYDSYQSRSAGDLTVPVAKVRIIHTQQGLSVARFYADISRNEIPVLEENFILVGDKLDLATATRDKKSASNDGDAPAPAAAPAPAPAAPALAPPPPAAAAPAPATPPAAAPVEQKPVPAQVTSLKIDVSPANPKENSPGVQATQGPTIQ